MRDDLLRYILRDPLWRSLFWCISADFLFCCVLCNDLLCGSLRRLGLRVGTLLDGEILLRSTPRKETLLSRRSLKLQPKTELSSTFRQKPSTHKITIILRT